MPADMLRIAKAVIMIATNILKTDDMQDEVYLNIAGYHCSQVAEKVKPFNDPVSKNEN